MKDDYGSLRRRTRDAGWQWLMIGLTLGLGFALVICVGGYALGGIAFPLLEGDTATSSVRIVPNETEIAQQAATQQSETSVAQVPGGAEVAPIVTLPAGDTPAAVEMTPADTFMPSTPDPTLLPMGAVTEQETPAAAETESAAEPVAAIGEGDAEATPAEVVTETESTPALGSPPEEPEAAALGLPQAPAVPPELDAIKTEMVEVTGGTFMMGTTLEEATQAMDECQLYGKTCEDLSWVSDSTPPHQTTVDTFSMEVYEVTVTQFVTFLNWKGPNSHKTQCQGQPCAQTDEEQENSLILFDGTTYSVRNPGFYSQHPATYVTWWGAVEYCAALNRRLPTEAEWERAARGSQNRTYPWGFEFDIQRAMTSIQEQAGTVSVTSYPSGISPYGVFNMAGNVSEWVSDWYQPDYYTQQLNAPDPNPKGPIAGTEKVHRGGSWDTIPLFLRSVHRMSRPPGNPTAAIGFRCVADVGPALPVAPSTPATSGDTGAGGAPTLPPAPTQAPLPTSTLAPSGPTPTLAPG
ncbi:MAG: SUMF1/EgtB/PvdO family nonheme iron enzyme [Anaerolineae bacterium]|nr:SUMF1/EgtB/PvdO family nonheme iron enzyme [Anaerolineae bacterium]